MGRLICQQVKPWEDEDLNGIEDSLLYHTEALKYHTLLCPQIVYQPLQGRLCLHRYLSGPSSIHCIENRLSRELGILTKFLVTDCFWGESCALHWCRHSRKCSKFVYDLLSLKTPRR